MGESVRIMLLGLGTFLVSGDAELSLFVAELYVLSSASKNSDDNDKGKDDD